MYEIIHDGCNLRENDKLMLLLLLLNLFIRFPEPRLLMSWFQISSMIYFLFVMMAAMRELYTHIYGRHLVHLLGNFSVTVFICHLLLVYFPSGWLVGWFESVQLQVKVQVLI